MPGRISGFHVRVIAVQGSPPTKRGEVSTTSPVVFGQRLFPAGKGIPVVRSLDSKGVEDDDQLNPIRRIVREGSSELGDHGADSSRMDRDVRVTASGAGQTAIAHI